MMTQQTQYYRIHGSLVLVIHSSSSVLLNGARRCLGQFVSSAEAYSVAGLPKVELTLVEHLGTRFSEQENQRGKDILWEVRTEELVNRRYVNKFTACYGRETSVEYFPAIRKGYAYISETETLYHLAFTCLIPVLDWVLKESEFFLVHAAAVGFGGKGLLLVAPSGVGKSTTTVLLAKAGFSLLHDDCVWVREQKSHVNLFRVPGPIRVNRDVLMHLATEARGQVTEEICREQTENTGKYQFFAEDIPSFQAVPSVKCNAVCFLSRHGVESSFHPISTADAIERLTQQSFLATDPLVAKNYLKTLVHLAETVPQFTVRLGTDFRSIPRVFHKLLRQINTS
jgi:hypothetical protein